MKKNCCLLILHRKQGPIFCMKANILSFFLRIVGACALDHCNFSKAERGRGGQSYHNIPSSKNMKFLEIKLVDIKISLHFILLIASNAKKEILFKKKSWERWQLLWRERGAGGGGHVKIILQTKPCYVGQTPEKLSPGFSGSFRPK